MIIMKKVIEYFNGRIDRFNYFLSLLIVMAGFFYVDWFCNDHRCLVCHPIMNIPWRDLFWNFIVAIGGIYTYALTCIFVLSEEYVRPGFIVALSCSIFGMIQSIKRCHDRNESGWRVLIPFYPLFLLFLPGKTDNAQLSRKALVYNTLIDGKWLIFVLLFMIGAIYRENSRNIRMHNRYYSDEVNEVCSEKSITK